jgi:hypothetical protein
MKTTITTAPPGQQFTTEITVARYRFQQPDELRTGRVQLTINVADILRELGGKALLSGGGRARALRGAVSVKVLRR